MQLPVESSIRSEGDIDRLLMGMAYQLAEAEDHTIVEDLRGILTQQLLELMSPDKEVPRFIGRVFGPLEFSRRDLMAVNIQRGREHGIPDFNTAREAYGLPRYTHGSNFTCITNV